MRNLNRSTLILVLVAVLGMTLAAIAAARSGGGNASAMGTYGQKTSSGQVGLADTTASTNPVNPLSVDPAKAQPILDQFHSRDPFIQVTAAPASSGGTGGGTSPAPSPSASASSVPTGATVTIKNHGTFTNQPVGKVLLGKYKISDITASSVKFTLVGGWTLADETGKSNGETTFTVQTNAVSKVTTVDSSGSHVVSDYMSVTIVFTSSGGGGGSGGSGSGNGSGGSGSGGGSGGSSGSTVTQSGHAIKVLSIDTQNGKASCTMVVDSVTYANKHVGDVFATGWGQIKVLGINVGAQTVTILHADAQVTLHVGQSVGK